MFHKVREIKPCANYELFVVFENGEKKSYNVRPLMDKWDPFDSLVTIQGLFEQVKVDAGGYGVSWNDEIDLSCDELYHHGVSVEKR